MSNLSINIEKMGELQVHRVKKVTRGEPRSINSTNYRSLFIYTEDGEKYEISLFSDKITNLIIKEEKE